MGDLQRKAQKKKKTRNKMEEPRVKPEHQDQESDKNEDATKELLNYNNLLNSSNNKDQLPTEASAEVAVPARPSNFRSEDLQKESATKDHQTVALPSTEMEIMPAECEQVFSIQSLKNIRRLAELYSHTGCDKFLTLHTAGLPTPPASPVPPSPQQSAGQSYSELEWVLLNKVIGQDIQFPKALVDPVCDLIVGKKKPKHRLHVCSSEEVDKCARYVDFSSIAFIPGYDVFKDYRDNGYNVVAVKFDWSQYYGSLSIKLTKEEGHAVTERIILKLTSHWNRHTKEKDGHFEGVVVALAKAGELKSSTMLAEAGELKSSTMLAESEELKSSTKLAEAGELKSSTLLAKMGDLTSSTMLAEAGELKSSTLLAKVGGLTSSTMLAEAGELKSSTLLAKVGELTSSTMLAEAGELKSSTLLAKAGELISSTMLAEASTMLAKMRKLKISIMLDESYEALLEELKRMYVRITRAKFLAHKKEMKWNTKEKEKCCKREEVAALMKLMSRNKPEESYEALLEELKRMDVRITRAKFLAHKKEMKWNTKEKEKCCKREEVAALMKLMSRNKPEEVQEELANILDYPSSELLELSFMKEPQETLTNSLDYAEELTEQLRDRPDDAKAMDHFLAITNDILHTKITGGIKNAVFAILSIFHHKLVTLDNGSTTDVQNLFLTVLTEVSDPSFYLWVIGEVSRRSIPRHREKYKIFGAYDNFYPKKFKKSAVKHMGYISGSCSEVDGCIYRNCGHIHEGKKYTLKNSIKMINGYEEMKPKIEICRGINNNHTNEHNGGGLPLFPINAGGNDLNAAEGGEYESNGQLEFYAEDVDEPNQRDNKGWEESHEVSVDERKSMNACVVSSSLCYVSFKQKEVFGIKVVDTGRETRKENGPSLNITAGGVSRLVGTTRSVIDSIRKEESSSYKRSVSWCCIRHTMVSGLSRKVMFDSDICSNFHERVMDKNKLNRFDRVVKSDRMNESCTSSSRNIPHHSELEKGKTKDFDQSSPNNKCSLVINEEIQDLIRMLHAGSYKEIVHSVDHRLQGTSADKYFISGLAHFKLKNYSDAEVRFLSCDEMCYAQGKQGDSALCNLYLGDIQCLSHLSLDACTYYQKAISRYSKDTVAALFRMVPPSLSCIHAKRASALRNLSKMVDATQEYKLAIKVATTEKDRLAANTSLGNLYQSMGENVSALSHYEKSVQLSKKLCDHISLGWAHGNMGNAHLGLFQKDKALYHLREALNLTLEHERTPQAIGRAYNNLGTAHQSLGDLDKAQEYYDLALRQAEYGCDKSGLARVCGNMGNVLMLHKKYEEAVPRYTEVLTLSKDRSTCSTAHHNRGCAYYEWSEAKMETLHSTNPVGNSEELTKGSFVLDVKFYVHGLDFKDISDLCPRNVPDSIAEYYNLGCEDLNEVIKFHEDHLDNIKGSSKGLTLSISLFETNSRTFHRLQDCLVNLGEYPKALLVAEQSRARTLGELMLKKKEWYLQNPLTSPMQFDQIVAAVESIECPILYLSYTGARLLGWVFVTMQNEIKLSMFEVPLKDDLFDGKPLDYHVRYNLPEALVERSFEMYHEVGDYNEFTSAPVQTLYNLIAKPLLVILKQYKAYDAGKLVVISDSYTGLLPFSSLHDHEANTFLGDHFCFQFMPSFLTMSILNQLSDINIVNLPTDAHNLCIVGNPNIPQFKYNDEVWNLGKLPHAKREAESVAHIMKTIPILETQATKNAVLMRIMNAKIIHLATHGSASSGFLAFGTLAPMGKDEAVHSQGVLLYPVEVEKLNINPALVVLSSCDSGRGAVKADGIQSMARAFILAGAQAVLTTLWRVPDESAAIFMQFFYQYMMDGLESTKALQKAILSIRCFSKYSQYIHWSGYQLTGRDVHIQYTKSLETCVLEKRLGKSKIFPRLQDMKMLESELVDTTCYPTDVQILQASPGLDAQEVVIDFIHSFYKHFTGGIFWINCQHPEFVYGSIKYIEKRLKITLEQLQLSELQQCLFVFDGISELPTSESLQKLMGHRYVHCIMLYEHYLPPDNLIRTIDIKLLRGCKVHQLEPLSMILSTQRIVYSVQTEVHFSPKCADQAIIEKISNFTCGSPVLENILSLILPAYLTSSQKSPQEGLNEFAGVISLDLTREKRSSPSSGSPSTSCSSSLSSSQSLGQQLSSSMSDAMTSISTLSQDCRDEADSSCSFDSWDSIIELLNACKFDSDAKFLLNCLSYFGCVPIPLKFVIFLSNFITKTSGRTHLAGSLHSLLMDKGFLKLYPSPVVTHSNLNPETGTEFVCVPKYLSDCLLKELEDPDILFALKTCFSMLTKESSECPFFLGLLKYLKTAFELNFELLGENCYKEIYRQYLSHI